MNFLIRSPRFPIGGIFVLARVIDKVRLQATGQLPEGYWVGPQSGNRTFDDRLCCFLGVNFEELQAMINQGGSDEEILDWCFARGRKPDSEQIEVWNGFLSKRGWRDSGSAGLVQQKIDAGFGDRDDIQTYFDLIDAEEGRA
ncbi:MAG: DUF5069 domain-containing protein [Akkermansiaceae bacterium]|nr:DUF5069 domain-containing protein [Akkermansiaceae bacterium]